MEKITDISEYRDERFKSIKVAITKSINLFLERNAIAHVDIIWSEDSDIFILNFTLQVHGSDEPLLTGDSLHRDLIKYLSEEITSELEGYTPNPYVKSGYISFIKE
jgi:hypothetical protein